MMKEKEGDREQGKQCGHIRLNILAVQSTCRSAATASAYVIVSQGLDSTHHQH